MLTPTRRHSYIISLLGSRQIVLAVNKMDLVTYSQDIFMRIDREYREFAGLIGVTDVTCIPMSAVHGDTVFPHGPNMPWYAGPTLMEHLERVPVGALASAAAPTSVADQFEATVIWMHDDPMLRGRPYLITIGTQTTPATVALLKRAPQS